MYGTKRGTYSARVFRPVMIQEMFQNNRLLTSLPVFPWTVLKCFKNCLLRVEESIHQKDGKSFSSGTLYSCDNLEYANYPMVPSNKAHMVKNARAIFYGRNLSINVTLFSINVTLCKGETRETRPHPLFAITLLAMQG